MDPGATCVTLDDGDPLTVTVTGGPVDTDTPGIYEVAYSCSHNGQHASTTQKVTVSWFNSNPVIGIVSVRTAIGAGDVTTDYSSDANCVDQQDGNLPVTATITFHGDGRTATITYSCTDSRGSSASTTQEVAVLGSSPPGICLIEPGIHYMNAGDAWTDPGAYCMDAEDGRIPAQTTRSDLDTSKPGHYTVSYECTDSDGNSDSILRNILVQAAHQNLPPALVISDRSDIIISVNGTWSIPPATCANKEDGDLTDLIWMWGVDGVDPTAPGTYRLTYFCSDSEDEQVQATVTVRVIEWRGSSSPSWQYHATGDTPG